MGGVLIRFGALLIILDIAYLTLWEVFAQGADDDLFRLVLKGGGVLIGGGILVWALGKVTSRRGGATCPKCSRGVVHGRIYCDAHRSDTINRYRDRERGI